MKYPKNPLAQIVIQLCKAKKIDQVVISPGSRNAPLTIGFTEDDYFSSYSIVDERCAAFFALGIAQQTNRPVALVCTSGSALLNYYPAIAEAFYSDIPLVVLSADRPEHLVDIGDGQTIKQPNVFGDHVLFGANLSEERLSESEEQTNKALDTAIAFHGPVHINLPFTEPLYETVEEISIHLQSDEIESTPRVIDTDLRDRLVNVWNGAKRKMILVGVNGRNKINRTYLDQLASDESVIVFTETTSNLHHPGFFPSIDKIIAPLDPHEFESLRPEVLITFGGMVVSKKIKAFLRAYRPQEHWHIDEKNANDTYFCLTQHIRTSPEMFFKSILPCVEPLNSNYNRFWTRIKQIRQDNHSRYLQGIEFSDLKVFDSLFKAVPEQSILQLGNSSTVRYAQLFDLKEDLEVYCNRGTSGIDGSTSTSIGCAVVRKEQTVLITGDLSFFYDSNALWNNYIPQDFRIIIINNSGGGIFRILPGNKDSDTFDRYFETKHKLNASHLSKMYGFQYHKAENKMELDRHINNFFDRADQPKILEIFTPRTLNDKILLDYFSALK